jgi:hypothetical protein
VRALALIAVLAFPGAAIAAPCLTPERIEAALGDQVRAKAAFIDISTLPDMPLCNGLTLAQQIQRMRTAAFPEEAQTIAQQNADLVSQNLERRRIEAQELARRIEEDRKADLAEQRRLAEEQAKADRTWYDVRQGLVSTGRSGKKAKATKRRGGGGAGYYASCKAARAAGAAPLRRGDPGYRSGLDRDGDGIACE